MTVARPMFALAGGALLLAGLVAFAAVAAVVYGDCGACRAWSLRLGLSLTLLASGAAQSLILLGAWLIWSARRRA